MNVRNFTGIACLVLFAISGCAPTDPNHPQFVVAEGNHFKITREELSKALEPQLKHFDKTGSKLSEARKGQMESRMLDQMIMARLFKDEAKALGLEDEVKKDVEAMMNRFHKRFQKKEDLEQFLEKTNQTVEALNEKYYALVCRRLVMKKATPKDFSIDSEGIRQYYEKNIRRWSQPERAEVEEVRIFIIHQEGDEAKAAKKKSIAALRSRLLKGEKIQSIRESLKDSKELNARAVARSVTYPKGRLAPELDSVVFALEDGKVSEVVEGKDGFYVFRLVKKEAPQTLPLERVERSIKPRLIEGKKAEFRETYLADLKKKANVKIHLSQPKAKGQEAKEMKEK